MNKSLQIICQELKYTQALRAKYICAFITIFCSFVITVMHLYTEVQIFWLWQLLNYVSWLARIYVCFGFQTTYSVTSVNNSRVLKKYINFSSRKHGSIFYNGKNRLNLDLTVFINHILCKNYNILYFHLNVLIHI